MPPMKPDKLVREGIPFRDAYRQIGQHLDEISLPDPVENIKSKTHIGATGNLDLSTYATEIEEAKDQWTENQTTFIQILDQIGNKGTLNHCL